MSVETIVQEIEAIAPTIASVLNMPIIGSIVLGIIAKALNVPESSLASVFALLGSDPLVQQALVAIEAELVKLKL